MLEWIELLMSDAIYVYFDVQINIVSMLEFCYIPHIMRSLPENDKVQELPQFSYLERKMYERIA